MVEKFVESSTYDYSLDSSSSLRLQPFIDGSLKSLPDHKTLVGVPPRTALSLRASALSFGIAANACLNIPPFC